jgi:glycosyltransferase involved in cell wall biosynthesis
MSQPNLVSIVLPVSNAGSYLSECLDSLLNQTYKEIEVIAIDDNSSDNSYSLLRKYKKKDGRLRVYKNKKRYGISVCFNRAVKKARGGYITFMDAHDKSTLYRIKRQLLFLQNNPKIAAVGAQCTFLTADGKKIEKSTFPSDPEGIKQSLLGGLGVKFETLLINRARIPKDLLKFTTNAYPFIYTDVLLKLMQYGHIVNLEQYLHYHRQMTKKAYVQLDRIEKWLSTGKVWVKTLRNEDTRPPLRDLIPSFPLPLKLSK